MRPSILLAITLIGCGSDSVDPVVSNNQTGGTSGTFAVTTGGTNPSVGGAVAVGGIGVGGARATGGAPAATGGAALGTGGVVATGGRATGGAATGGKQTGGVTTGGAQTGGAVATGGSATGGLPATGGVATGGVTSTGGNLATGGAAPATGGSGTICPPHTSTDSPPTCLFDTDPADLSQCIGTLNRAGYPDSIFQTWTNCPNLGALVCGGKATQNDRDCWWACLVCVHSKESTAAWQACTNAMTAAGSCKFIAT
jgi:hypothetical protein